MTKNTVAFITYNTVGNLTSGWHDGPEGRRVLIVQNTNTSWAVQELFTTPDRTPSNYARSDAKYVDIVKERIDQVWEKLREELSKLDHVVIYVGSKGSERAIALATQLPANKITFVGCGCGLTQKEAMIQASGLMEAQRILCECGGRYTMEEIFHKFIETGNIINN